jgi:hypothetical protein
MYHKCTVSYHKSISLKQHIDEKLFEDKTTESKTQKQQFSVYLNQAGGHSRIFNVDDQKIAKPCNPQEANFYQHIHSEPLLEPLVPKYWKNIHIDNISDDYRRSFQTPGEFIILENLTSGFNHPCVMDIKLGNINYDPSRHLQEKIRMRKVKLGSTTSGKLGVRLSALRVFRPRHGNYLIHTSKTFHHLHTERHLKWVLKLYLHDGYRLRTELIPMFIKQLKELLSALKNQTTFEFLSSSVLFIYEGDLENVQENKPATKGTRVVVRLIDFDHASIRPHPPGIIGGQQEAVDPTGVILGISTLINILQKILFCAKKPKTDSEIQYYCQENSLRKLKKRFEGSQSEDEAM